MSEAFSRPDRCLQRSTQRANSDTLISVFISTTQMMPGSLTHKRASGLRSCIHTATSPGGWKKAERGHRLEMHQSSEGKGPAGSLGTLGNRLREAGNYGLLCVMARVSVCSGCVTRRAWGAITTSWYLGGAATCASSPTWYVKEKMLNFKTKQRPEFKIVHVGLKALFLAPRHSISDETVVPHNLFLWGLCRR